MAHEPVRAAYRHTPTLLGVLAMLAATVALPIVAVFVDAAPWWQEALFLLVAIGFGWWEVLFRIAYRMELTDTALVLRAPLARTRIPLQELATVGGPPWRNAYRVRRRDGSTWTFLAGDGFVGFLDEVARAAPDADVRVSGLDRASERAGRFFSGRDR